ncbi:hypothetical protein [Stenotrophomonas sp. JAI102]|nr:hypothetical protein [Stenotrophomonas sp. JAI102]
MAPLRLSASHTATAASEAVPSARHFSAPVPFAARRQEVAL